MLIVIVCAVVAIVLLVGGLTLVESQRSPIGDEREAAMPNAHETFRLVGEMPVWLRPTRRGGRYAPRDVYYAGRENGHAPSVMRKRLLEFDPGTTGRARRWWRSEVEAAHSIDKSLPKLPRRKGD